MALIDKLTAIADSIRAKTGSEDALTLDEMPVAIESIETGDPNAASTVKRLIQRTITDLRDDTVTKVGDFALQHCISLKSVDFPECTTVGDYGFYGCKFLEHVNLPKVTTLTGAYNFGNCQLLEELRLPRLTLVRDGYFIATCSMLKALILPGDTLCALNSSYALYSSPVASGTCFVYVPAALVDSYKAAANWKKYPNQFRALEDYTVDGTINGELDRDKI